MYIFRQSVERDIKIAEAYLPLEAPEDALLQWSRSSRHADAHCKLTFSSPQRPVLHCCAHRQCLLLTRMAKHSAAEPILLISNSGTQLLESAGVRNGTHRAASPWAAVFASSGSVMLLIHLPQLMCRLNATWCSISAPRCDVQTDWRNVPRATIPHSWFNNDCLLKKHHFSRHFLYCLTFYLTASKDFSFISNILVTFPIQMFIKYKTVQKWSKPR